MKLIPIQVECYAGAKADETPRRFTWEGRTIELSEVLDRWYQVESKPEWPRADYFKVRAAGRKGIPAEARPRIRRMVSGTAMVMTNIRLFQQIALPAQSVETPIEQ